MPVGVNAETVVVVPAVRFIVADAELDIVELKSLKEFDPVTVRVPDPP